MTNTIKIIVRGQKNFIYNRVLKVPEFTVNKLELLHLGTFNQVQILPIDSHWYVFSLTKIQYATN